MKDDDKFYPFYGATLEHVAWDEQGNLVLHFKDERGFRHTLNVREKEKSMIKSIAIYAVALLIVIAFVLLAMGAI